MRGYLILAKKQFINPKKFSDAWNFGTKNNSIKSVKEIVEYMISFWGNGKIKYNKKTDKDGLLTLSIIIPLRFYNSRNA